MKMFPLPRREIELANVSPAAFLPAPAIVIPNIHLLVCPFATMVHLKDGTAECRVEMEDIRLLYLMGSDPLKRSAAS